jgi:prepilin-type N-terminal cleavage/methylation domain-containing protein
MILPRIVDRRARHAFTLLELLAVIAAIALLIAALLPSLVSARITAERVASLSNIRQHCQVFAAYSSDYSGFFPFVTNPNAEWSTLGRPYAGSMVKFFDASFAWNYALAPAYYAGDPRDFVFMSPEYRRRSAGERPFWSQYAYSSSFVTDWRYWTPETRLRNRSQWRAVRMDQARFPSAKGLLVFKSALYADEVSSTVDVALVDGSARLVWPSNLTPPYRGGDGAHPFGSSVSLPMSVVHTVMGYRGRDIQ